MNDTAVIFGAGKTGRGFAAHLAFLAGCRIVLVDKDKLLIESLCNTPQYSIEVFGAPQLNCNIDVAAAFCIDDPGWHGEFINSGVAFTAVFGDNLPGLGVSIAQAIEKRYKQIPERLLTILTCENMTNAAGVLKQQVVQNLHDFNKSWLQQTIAFSECIVFRTCLEGAKNSDPLTVRAQNYFRLPCNGDVLKEKPLVYGLEPLRNFKDQLKKKIYTYNCINAVIAYLGARKGCHQLHEAGNDPEIMVTARMAAIETCRAQVMEFGFDAAEQEDWMNAAFEKFRDINIPDPISRNGADPARKLRRDDRLVGPALLAIKHGIHPEGLIEGVCACVEYRDPHTDTSVRDIISKEGVEYVLTNICGLYDNEKLFKMLKSKLKIEYPHAQN